MKILVFFFEVFLASKKNKERKDRDKVRGDLPAADTQIINSVYRGRGEITKPTELAHGVLLNLFFDCKFQVGPGSVQLRLGGMERFEPFRVSSRTAFLGNGFPVFLYSFDSQGGNQVPVPVRFLKTAPIGIIERGVPKAYVRARASSATLCSVHILRLFLCIFYIEKGI